MHSFVYISIFQLEHGTALEHFWSSIWNSFGTWSDNLAIVRLHIKKYMYSRVSFMITRNDSITRTGRATCMHFLRMNAMHTGHRHCCNHSPLYLSIFPFENLSITYMQQGVLMSENKVHLNSEVTNLSTEWMTLYELTFMWCVLISIYIPVNALSQICTSKELS